MKKIAIEEHVGPDGFTQIDKRLRDMDEAGIDMQVLSRGPGGSKGPDLDVIDFSKKSNDMMAEVIAKYPDRFSGFASIPLKYPEEAAKELERAVKTLGLKGTLLYTGQVDDYLDESKYWAVYETAQKLDVPIYLHPGSIMPDMSAPYMTYPIISLAMWGFGAAVSLQVMRFICSGLFDKYPRFNIILGHLGENIPYSLWRIDKHWKEDQFVYGKDAPGNDLKKKPTEYFRENFYITTSGMLWAPAVQFAISVLGSDRILFACDYPPEPALDAARFIESLPINDVDRSKICHLNAERLLRL